MIDCLEQLFLQLLGQHAVNGRVILPGTNLEHSLFDGRQALHDSTRWIAEAPNDNLDQFADLEWLDLEQVEDRHAVRVHLEAKLHNLDRECQQCSMEGFVAQQLWELDLYRTTQSCQLCERANGLRREQERESARERARRPYSMKTSLLSLQDLLQNVQVKSNGKLASVGVGLKIDNVAEFDVAPSESIVREAERIQITLESWLQVGTLRKQGGRA